MRISIYEDCLSLCGIECKFQPINQTVLSVPVISLIEQHRQGMRSQYRGNDDVEVRCSPDDVHEGGLMVLLARMYTFNRKTFNKADARVVTFPLLFPSRKTCLTQGRNTMRRWSLKMH